MTKFYVDQNGVYQNGWPDDMSPPQGWMEVSSAPVHAHQIWNFETETWGSIPGAPEDVYRERDRRLALGFDYDFGDARGIHRVGTTKADLEGWSDVTTIAQTLINVGQPSQQIHLVTDTGPVTVTATEWQQILLAAAAFRQPIWQASFLIATDDPLLADIAADPRWP